MLRWAVQICGPKRLKVKQIQLVLLSMTKHLLYVQQKENEAQSGDWLNCPVPASDLFFKPDSFFHSWIMAIMRLFKEMQYLRYVK